MAIQRFNPIRDKVMGLCLSASERGIALLYEHHRREIRELRQRQKAEASK